MKEIKYNTVGDYEFPELKQERPLPNLSRFGREWKLRSSGFGILVVRRPVAALKTQRL